MVGVSRDTVAAQANFKAKYEVPFPLLADVESEICDAFGVIVEKNMYGKKSLGIQRSTFLIEDGDREEGVAEGQGRGSRGRGSLIAVEPLRITVAGSSCSVPRIDRACSAYLIEDGGFAFSLDFGTGAFANMRRYADYDRLGRGRDQPHARRPLPRPDPAALRRALRLEAAREAAAGVDAAGRHRDAALDDQRVRQRRQRRFPRRGLRHARVRSGTARCRSATGGCASRRRRTTSRRLRSATNATARASPTRPTPRPTSASSSWRASTDLFLCEATLLADEEEHGGMRGHSSPKEAAQMAADAGVERLVLTHYSQDATAERPRSTAPRSDLQGRDHRRRRPRRHRRS